MLTAALQAAPVQGIQCKLLEPVCPRGGVMMLPLKAQVAGDHWPQTIELKLADGRGIAGQVAWIYESSRPFDAIGPMIRAALPFGRLLPTTTPRRLIPEVRWDHICWRSVPLDANGELTLDQQVLKPIWADIPAIESLQLGDDVNSDLSRPTMELTPATDRPDPVSPFEFWRWVLLAERFDMKPPRPFGGDIERMAAEHYAALWRIGLGRIQRQSERIASQCRDLLTRSCIDHRGGRPQPFATWVADPAQIGPILARLLDFAQARCGSPFGCRCLARSATANAPVACLREFCANAGGGLFDAR